MFISNDFDFKPLLLPAKKGHSIQSVPGNALLISKNNIFKEKTLDFALLIMKNVSTSMTNPYVSEIHICTPKTSLFVSEPI